MFLHNLSIVCIDMRLHANFFKGAFLLVKVVGVSLIGKAYLQVVAIKDSM